MKVNFRSSAHKIDVSLYPMKICVITFQFPPEINGGVGTAVHRITRNLATSGVQIHVIAPGFHSPEDTFTSSQEEGIPFIAPARDWAIILVILCI